MGLSQILRADFGSHQKVQVNYTGKEKASGWLSLVRPIFLVMTPLNAASAAILSIRGWPSWQQCLAGFFTGFFAAAGVNAFNQFADRRRDAMIWPSRSIPSGRVKPLQALALALICYALALAIIWIFFNPTAFVVLLAAIVLGSLYSTHLRDRIGYLSLPLIEGLIFLCGWAALSPATLGSLLPWYLYFLGVVWQSAHITAHYALHMRKPEEKRPLALSPWLFIRPSMVAAALITTTLTLLLVVLSLVLPFLTPLSLIYVLPVAAFGLFTLYHTWAFARASQERKNLLSAWNALSLFRMVISLALIISVLVFP